MKNMLAIIFTLLFITFSSYSSAGLIFTDGFESGNMSTTDADGFHWGQNNATSIVTTNPKCGGLSSGDSTAIYNNKAICNGPISGTNWTAKDGNNSLRFHFGAGKYMAEQRFTLGKHYPEIWLHYWIRVPVNFYQGTLNNKFLALWVDTYDSLGDVTWQTRPNPDNAGGATLVVQDGGVAHGEQFPTPFITYPDDQGRWMEIVAHVKVATTRTSNDGVIQLWRRWSGDKYYTKIHEKLNASVYEVGAPVQGISHGYIFGWANDPYKVSTNWLVDDFSIYDSYTTPKTASDGKRPAKNTLNFQ